MCGIKSFPLVKDTSGIFFFIAEGYRHIYYATIDFIS